MKYPNLIWAIGQRRYAHYEVARAAAMTESRFSRCLSGRFEFSGEEQREISALLDYSRDWLFAKITPPIGARDEVAL
jgi:hypothetical protein